MADKKFNRKFMHPTRRKLADMVRTGEYEKNTQIGFSDIKETKTKRKVGDIWSDSDGNVWEQKDFGKVKYKTPEDDGHLSIRAFWPCFKSEGTGTLISFPEGFIQFSEGKVVTLTISSKG